MAPHSNHIDALPTTIDPGPGEDRMHRTRIYMRRVVAVSLLGTMSTLNACSTPAPTALTGSSAVRATYDGEALFLGIFFGEGAVGKSLSEIWSGGGAEALLTSPEQVPNCTALNRRRLRVSGPVIQPFLIGSQERPKVATTWLCKVQLTRLRPSSRRRRISTLHRLKMATPSAMTP